LPRSKESTIHAGTAL
jgi:hypothetical protein